jgi:cation transport protein ChaC
LNDDTFRHVPALRERLKPLGQSSVRATPEVMAVWDERARLMGQPADWRWSDERREASRQSLLARHEAGADLWVYGYGSLMWDPALHFCEVRHASLDAHQRRFSFHTHLGRGSPQCPGLMLSLDPQPGVCHGLAFRIPAHQVEPESCILWRREMIRGNYQPAFLPVQTPQGTVNALVFTSNPDHPEYAGELALEEAARVIATASGVLGTNREYLEQLAAQLALLQIEDDYIARLHASVRAAPASRS